MTHADLYGPVVFWTSDELDRLAFARWLRSAGRIGEQCDDHGDAIALPVRPFPITATPTPVGDGWSDSCS